MIMDLFIPHLGGGEYKFLIHNTQLIYSFDASKEDVNFEYTIIYSPLAYEGRSVNI